MQNALVTINKVGLPIRMYAGQLVLTLRDVDSVHERVEGTARKRFNDNKKHFIKGEDFFVLKTDEAARMYGIMAPRGLVVITETGYLMLVKSFNDEHAWKVQRELINGYFRAEGSRGSIMAYLDRHQRMLDDERRENAKLRHSIESFEKMMNNTLEVLNRLVLNTISQQRIPDIESMQNGLEDKNSAEEEFLISFGSYCKKTNDLCDRIVLLERKGNRRKVLKEMCNRLTEIYGVCWEQEKKDYIKQHESKPETLELIYWMECEKKVYRNLLCSLLQDQVAALEKSRKDTLQFPVETVYEMRRFMDHLITVTGNKSPNGSSAYRSFFRYLDSKVEINWQHNENMCRNRRPIASSLRVSKMEIVERIASTRAKVLPVFNEYIMEYFPHLVPMKEGAAVSELNN